MAASAMSAGEVSRAARRDLQFRIPRRPVLRLGLRPRPQEETWVVDGARKSQVLAGAFAREHMGDLLRACDGSRTLAQIGQETGIGEQAAFEAVSLLWTGGIVEEGDTEALSGPPPAPELACLLSRLGDSTGVNDSWQDAARRLAAARVTIVGGGGLADRLAEALEPTLPVRTGRPRPEDTLVVLIETSGGGDGGTGEVARRCWELGIPLLRVRAEQEAVTVGPYVDPAFSPCLECATAGDPEPGPAPEPARQDLAVGMAARAVAALIARATITHLPGDVRRTDLETLSTTERPVVTRPGCPVCSISGGPPKNPQEGRRAEQSLPSEPSGPGAGLAPVGARYEQSVAIPPAVFVDSKGHQQHYKPSNLRLQHEFRDWPTAARTPLPPADLSALDQPWPTGDDGGPRAERLQDGQDDQDARAARAGRAPSLEELATILALCVGVREPLAPGAQPSAQEARAKLRRWTAAGGNIGSVTAYLLVPGQAEPAFLGPAGAVRTSAPAPPGGQAAPGTYVYVERDHALARLGPSAELPDDVGVRLVLTGNVDKVARKYLAFALRIAVQDCGCSFEVARIVARALGVPLRARARWQEQEIAAALGTDPAREPICAVIDLGEGHAL
ncbi:TOMM precursor leader peptide-binding protein [Actinomyces bowdenii]|uniref:TOMM leader peptide-binding protein n=1 Tax=Actinomyces bowdenii TaxID=131109 RepID=A0A853EGE3_9ACTO|nr:TOMM precursor leader peptide-binding protein [Actinomyces bowdenii]MBF0696310.1 TOMM precursor leader peptide-binding protein [Actinomyces bowdenii]NYS68483.1 TOMM precursor leader peptide-binding protein [Actinomyces bowdenii]